MRSRSQQSLEQWLAELERDGVVELRAPGRRWVLLGAGMWFVLVGLVVLAGGDGPFSVEPVRVVVGPLAMVMGGIAVTAGLRGPALIARVTPEMVTVPGGVDVPWERVRGVAVRTEPEGGQTVHLLLRPPGVPLTDWRPEGWLERRNLYRLRRRHPGELPLGSGVGRRAEAVRALLLHAGQARMPDVTAS
jgi:hypothetical protein